MEYQREMVAEKEQEQIRAVVDVRHPKQKEVDVANLFEGRMIMVRTVEIGTHRFTDVICLDEPGAGGACHKYQVRRNNEDGKECPEPFANVDFQNGPVKEAGINGCHQEDLIAIVIDRLRSFQAGEFACRENALALTKLEEAMHWLNHRTLERQARGVEGLHKK